MLVALFITNSTNSLANYDTSSQVDTKIANSSGSGSADLSDYYTKSETDTLTSPTIYDAPFQSGTLLPSAGFRIYDSETLNMGIRQHQSSLGYALYKSLEIFTNTSASTDGSIVFKPRDVERMRLDPDGHFGIGTNSPHVPLHIVGGAIGTSSNPTLGIGAMNYFWHAGDADKVYRNPSFNHSNFGTFETTTSFYCTDDLWCGNIIGSFSGTISASDRRIKKEIVDIEDGLALERLRLLKPKQYQYVDDFKRGTEPVWGFIAQEVRETLPYATKLRTECLPNIYEVANVSASNVITLINFDTSTLESNAMVLKVYDTENKEHLVNIAEVIDGHSVRVNEDLTEWTEDDKIFVYGQQVQDFVMLQKEAIFTIATSALQELDRQLQAEKTRNDALEARILSLEKN